MRLRPLFLLLHLLPSVVLAETTPTHPALEPAPAHGKTKAFPTAEGYGAYTPGGRGGRVIAVTTLADAGAGSFREACLAEGPRIVIFRVGGMISAKKPIKIPHPFITIAAQTAPGDGICISGAPIFVEASDVVIRYLRVRVGDDPGGAKGHERDGIAIAKEDAVLSRVILDHCSVSWGIDENVSTWYGTRDITVQWCVISEALHNSLHEKGPHSMGLLIGDDTHRMSIHHNLFVHNNYRNPQPKGNTSSEIVNNVVLNWRYVAIPFVDGEKSGPAFADIIGNTFIPGADSRTDTGVIDLHKTIDPGTRVYDADNVVTSDLPLFVKYKDKAEYHVPARVLPPSGLLVEAAATAYERVLAEAGATLPKRDAVDLRVVDLVKTRGGEIIDSQRDVGGWPTYAAGEPPADSDNDGLPDAWEAQYQEGGANADPDQDGYLNIEEYLNGTDPKVPD